MRKICGKCSSDRRGKRQEIAGLGEAAGELSTERDQETKTTGTCEVKAAFSEIEKARLQQQNQQNVESNGPRTRPGTIT